ncbi:ABC-2 type transport system permease protein [Luteibacter rhizovicinus]|uniref:ABC-2 type transport system permease protein n=1 Tax=Luteibacter rhizovicinus TaxID=242606 RepID=A0A4R3YT82_9GAMM|nr:hypothetical protein [Luteibacter rhizovicinus]TCV94524.1 ABC-2 type transport system permease protein [Luteibacter rhizovicinus]
MKTFYWLVKREFWENRGGFYRAPLITAIVFLVLNLMAMVVGEVMGRRMGGFHFTGEVDTLSHLDEHGLAVAGAALDVTLYGFTALILAVTAIVVFFYCLGALYDDRRDRSVLFWKSLPVSDTSTVLSKVASAALVAPVIGVVVGVLGGLVLALMATIVATLHGVPLWQFLVEAHPFRVAFNLICLIPLYALWALPTIGWLLLCSAWARSKPFLWAIALPIGAAVVVQWFGLMGIFERSAQWFWVNVPGRLLLSIIPGGWVRYADNLDHLDKQDPGSILNAVGLSYHYSTLASPNVWVGAIAGALMIAGAIWFRRWREDT